MKTTETRSRKMTITIVFLITIFFGVFSYLILMPIAAWNHNVPLLITALAGIIIPVAAVRIIRHLGLLRVYREFQSTKGLLLEFSGLLITVFLLWNHQWLLTIIFVIATLIFKGGKK